VTIEDMETILMAITQGEASVMNSHLKKYLFGSRLSRTMGVNDFLEFLQELHTEIHTQQFENLLKDSR